MEHEHERQSLYTCTYDIAPYIQNSQFPILGADVERRPYLSHCKIVCRILSEELGACGQDRSSTRMGFGRAEQGNASRSNHNAGQSSQPTWEAIFTVFQRPGRSL